MEGVCIYLENNIPIISMYKSIYCNKVLHVIYHDKKLNYCIITTKELTNILPRNAIHILTKLPYCKTLNDTLSSWRIIVLNKLLKINKKSTKYNSSII